MIYKYEIPTSPQNQTFSILLQGGTYRFLLMYCKAGADNSGWILDIYDDAGEPLTCGIPLVTGADLLAQFAYLGIGGVMFCDTSGEPDVPPTETNLGILSNLWYAV